MSHEKMMKLSTFFFAQTLLVSKVVQNPWAPARDLHVPQGTTRRVVKPQWKDWVRTHLLSSG